MPQLKLPKHETNTFVDDQFSTIGFQPSSKIKSYLEMYFQLMQCYYNSNLLKLIPDKTKLMFISKPKFKSVTKYLSFKAGHHEIRPVPALKILGAYLSHDLSNEREISQIIPMLNNRINQFEKLKAHTDFQTRLQFSNAYIISRLLYMMPTYTNLNCHQRERIHKIIMRTARMTLNSYCFKLSIEHILGRCNWVDVDAMIKMSPVKFINSLLITQKPGVLYSNSKLSRRECTPISFKYFPKTSLLKNTLLFKVINYYNQLPRNIKFLPNKAFKIRLKKERHVMKQLSN